MKKCIICSGRNYKVVFIENGIDVVECENCGHVFSAFEREQNYDGYFGADKRTGGNSFWWDSAHTRMYDDFCEKYIDGKSGRLLDVGCGLGYFVKRISQAEKWKTEGYEISQTAVDYAKNNLELTNIHCGRVEKTDYPNNFFDIITMWDVIEHIPEPEPILKYLNKILKDDGFLFIHTPNIKIQLPKARIKKFFLGNKKKAHYLEARDHINNYSTKTLTDILSRNNFKKLSFTHLHPIQSVSGSRSIIFKILKNSWYNFSKLVYTISMKKFNLDNLFVVAKK